MQKEPKGHDVGSLGPSDSSDSGSDLPAPERRDTSDRHQTGERLSAERRPGVRPGADVDADRVVDDAEAGLGDGLDQAEEANVRPERGADQRSASAGARSRRKPG